MKTLVLLLCICLVLAAVLYVSGGTSDDVDGAADDVTLLSRNRRQGVVRRRGRGRGRRPHRGHGVTEGDEDGDEENVTGMRRPGRRNRPGRPDRPGRQGRRPGRRGQGRRRQRPPVDAGNLGLRAQRFISALSASQNQFASNLHKEVGRPVEDVIYSPYSIHQALTMTYLGARGRTAFQMKKTLSLQGLGRRTHRAYRLLNTVTNNPGNATLKVANAVYAKTGIHIEEAFTNGLTNLYNSSISMFDMEHEDGPEGPINEWVSRQTNALIPSILNPGTITQMTAMVLVNAIYFKASWNTTFDTQLTSEAMFSKTSSQQVPVQMMQIEDKFKTGVLPGHAARVLELPYRENRFSMVVILPDEIGGLATIEEGLTPEHLAVSLETAVSAKVKVSLPRFKLETSTSLKSTLENMGMGRAFNMGQADFSGIDGANDLYITDVIHRAVVEVNEEGSEAAGATAVIIGLRSMMPRPVPEFRCDHPFLFIIRDNVSKVNLFIGKFSGGS